MISRVNVTIAEADETLAVVVLRPQFDSGQFDKSIRVAGVIRGPYCETSHTLPTEFPLVDHCDSDGVRLEAKVVDPCYWTTKLPMLYEVQLDAYDAETLVGQHSTRIALRRSTAE